MNTSNRIELYTDGACSGNPGPGGYGAIIKYSDHETILSGGYKKTTNNRMELTAVIEGLQSLKENSGVTVYSDSKYVVDAVSKGWAVKWRANGWMRNKKEQALNPDLWAKLLKLCETRDTKFVWVKGHASNKDNNRCDELAVKAMSTPPLAVDEGYVKNPLKLL